LWTAAPLLLQIKVTDAGVEVGAGVTLSRLGATFKELIASRPGHETATLQAVVNQLRWFAGNQIRNVSLRRLCCLCCLCYLCCLCCLCLCRR
jgi:xanthine dehydrogenase/oxidase